MKKTRERTSSGGPSASATGRLLFGVWREHRRPILIYYETTSEFSVDVLHRTNLRLCTKISSFTAMTVINDIKELLLKTQSYQFKTYGCRAFSVCAHNLWNSLPLDLRLSENVKGFKNALKTELFLKRAYFSS